MLKLGCHVSMSGTDMMLGSVRSALEFGANTFMLYTGAPQNTRRKDISELKIDEAGLLMQKFGIEEFVVHAPYIINLANTIKPETYRIAVDFLALEIERTIKMGSKVLILHPGAHVGAGADAGISQIIKGLNEVVTADTKINIALETMAGKGTELGRTFEELAMIFDGVKYNEKLRVCFDTCHTNDAGYNIINDFDGVIEHFDNIIGKEKIAVFHMNDSKNEMGTCKDRHENFGFGKIGFKALMNIINHKDFEDVPKILESPYVKDPCNSKKSYEPFKHEISMIRQGVFNPDMINEILRDAGK